MKWKSSSLRSIIKEMVAFVRKYMYFFADVKKANSNAAKNKVGGEVCEGVSSHVRYEV